MSKIRYKTLEKSLKMLLKVEISEIAAAKEESTLRIFEIDIIPGKASFWSGNQCIVITRKPSDLDGLPNNNTDFFVQQIAAALSQLTLRIGANGIPVEIEKQDELWRKWLGIRENLADRYTGDWVDEKLSQVDQKMLPSDKLLQNIMQDMFLNEYFRGIYDVSFDGDSFMRQRTVYGVCPFPLQFNEKWTLQSSENAQLIKFSGNWNEQTIPKDFNRWLKSKTADALTQITIDGFYQVSTDTGWCNALHSNYTLIAGSGYEKTIKVTLTTN